MEDSAPGTYLDAIAGIIDLCDRRLQADRQVLAKFLNKSTHSFVDEIILSGRKGCTVNGRGLVQLSGALQRTSIGDEQRNDVLELRRMRDVGFRHVACNA